jgi:hypothetical protein
VKTNTYGLFGSVFLWVDYSFPVEAGRETLKAIIESSPRWDKRFWNLQVTDADEKAMQLRVLATAAISPPRLSNAVMAASPAAPRACRCK